MGSVLALSPQGMLFLQPSLLALMEKHSLQAVENLARRCEFVDRCLTPPPAHQERAGAVLASCLLNRFVACCFHVCLFPPSDQSMARPHAAPGANSMLRGLRHLLGVLQSVGYWCFISHRETKAGETQNYLPLPHNE